MWTSAALAILRVLCAWHRKMLSARAPSILVRSRSFLQAQVLSACAASGTGTAVTVSMSFTLNKGQSTAWQLSNAEFVNGFRSDIGHALNVDPGRVVVLSVTQM